VADTAADLVPAHPTLERLRDAAAGCRACPLWKTGTQTVFGEGPSNARVMLLGEQPGDREDLEGAPFVGPAGKLLDRALEAAEIERDLVYVTNAVKHFKWRQGPGKRRIHDTPNERELVACRPWLDAELAAVDPEVLVCLGATAAKAMLGRQFRVTRQRGQVFSLLDGLEVMATIHPSAVLRARDDGSRSAQMAMLVEDLGRVAHLLGDGGRRPSPTS
jgi:uracil-DNA glycosylase family protein